MTHALKGLPNELLVKSQLFGDISVPINAVITFPQGIPGFEETTRFALLPAAKAGLVWLQSLDNAALVFLVVEIARLLPESGYPVAGALAIVTLPREGGQATANLRAPVLIDRAACLGAQVIAADDSLSTTHPFDLAGLLR